MMRNASRAKRVDMETNFQSLDEDERIVASLGTAGWFDSHKCIAGAPQCCGRTAPETAPRFRSGHVVLTNLREQLGEEILGRPLPQGPPRHLGEPDVKGSRMMNPKFPFVKLKHSYCVEIPPFVHLPEIRGRPRRRACSHSGISQRDAPGINLRAGLCSRS